LIDPGFEESELLGGEVYGADFVSLWRHLAVPGVGGGLEHDALGALSGDDADIAIATLGHELGCLHVEAALGRGFVVTGDAVVLQEGADLLVVVDRVGLHREGGCGNQEEEERNGFHFLAVSFTRMRMGLE
jgi:hypothetical protein